MFNISKITKNIRSSLINQTNYCRRRHILGLDFTNEDDYKTGVWLAEIYLGFSYTIVIIMIHADDTIDKNTLGLTHMKILIWYMSGLLFQLMPAKGILNTIIIDKYVKLFLGICHYFESDVGFQTNQNSNIPSPFLHNSGNFVSLLNLSKQIIQYYLNSSFSNYNCWY